MLPDEVLDAPAAETTVADAPATETTVAGALDPAEDPGGIVVPPLESIVHEYLADDPPSSVTNEDIQCVADAITGSLTTERSVEVASALADGIAPSGIPIDAITGDEADLIVAAAELCLDWATVLTDAFVPEGIDPTEPPGLRECYAAASSADGYALTVLRMTLIDSPADEAALLPFVADCLGDVFRAEQTASMEQVGVSPEGQACVLDAMDFDSITALMLDQAPPSDEAAGLAMLDMMSAFSECLTNEEMGNVLGPRPSKN